jgi:DNA-binding LacI/PurR family transcriptional regulator
MRDVAEAAGVSPTTVSHALNGKGRVDPETVTRIRATAARLGYKPNPTARNLRRGRTGLLGLTNSVDPDMPVTLTDLDHFVRLVTAASATALARGYPLVLAPPADPATLDRSQVDGVIIVDPIADDPLIARANALEIPAITIGREPNTAGDGRWVDNDLAAATTTVLNHLEQAGARRIALLTPPPVHSWGLDIIDGYRDWTARRGVPEHIVVAQGALTANAGYAAVMELLIEADPPDAIHCVIDRYALGALLAAEHLGLRVPQDLLVTAGTDSEATRTASPAVTALELHPEIAGRRAAEFLIACLEEDDPEPHVLIPVDLVPRRSTDNGVLEPSRAGPGA